MITPIEEQQECATNLGLHVPLYFKREDLHPLGSHKGRSIPHMIDMHAGAGTTRFAISGSGNASLAALLYTQEYNRTNPDTPISLNIYVGENINEIKYERLEKSLLDTNHITISQVERPLQTVHKLNKSGEVKSLRQSMDDTALVGYKELADELVKIRPFAIFIPTSSGTTAQALGIYLSDTQIHIVQTTKIHTIANEFDHDFKKGDASLADAIVDIVGQRKTEVMNAIRRTSGSGWVVGDEEIEEAILLAPGLSTNSALAMAGLKKALGTKWHFSGPIVCLITGN